MKTVSQQFAKFYLLILAGITVTSIFFGPATARSSWWDKAVDMLKSPAGTTAQKALTSEEIGAGLKDALLVGSETVVAQLGTLNGFNLDPFIHIPLPEQFDSISSLLSRLGMSSMLEELELKLNRAAEAATPKAKALFAQAISEMTFEDVMNIYNGADNAATIYFKEKMSPALAGEMQPIVEKSLAEVGAIQAYDNVMNEYRAIPFVPDVNADLTAYVVEKGMDGIFHYIAVEEAAIRQNPAKRTTELLQRVFGAK